MAFRVPARTGALAAAAAAVLVCGFAAAPPAGRTTESARPPAPAAALVGALFEGGGTSGGHFCTASVVDSPARNLLITAAHCINGGKGGGYARGIVFIPGYRNGAAPYGVWTAQRLVVSPRWADSSDPDDDVGFVVLRPLRGRNIQQLLGASKLGSDTGYQYTVRVTGYPSSAGRPVSCLTRTSRESATQLQFDCDGFTDGTSGSPWVTQPKSGPGTVVGVIGGFQEGGDRAEVSYSPYFGTGIQQLYQQAIAAAR
jgi:V8-like Glu-specific endopeptidase